MTSNNAHTDEITRRLTEFAKSEIRPRRETLISSGKFPKDLWKAFAASGLAGLTVPAEFGGLGADYTYVSKAGHLLNRIGGVPGAAMMFMSHWLITRLHIAGDAPPDIKERLLPELSKGDKTISVAISEPGAGAHPKFLKTTARRDGDMFVINGEKAYLTNGPIADHFIVLAITNEEHARKEFSAILVPATTDGLQKTEGVKIDFLHPCPHGGITMKDCRVPVANMIGTEGKAFARTSLRMRAIEDAVGAGGQVGSMFCLLDDIATDAPEALAADIGAVATKLMALDVIASRLTVMADEASEDVQPLLELQLGFHQQCQSCASSFGDLLEKMPAPRRPEVDLLYRDITKSLNIARNAHAVRLTKIGRALMNK